MGGGEGRSLNGRGLSGIRCNLLKINVRTKCGRQTVNLKRLKERKAFLSWNDSNDVMLLYE